MTRPNPISVFVCLMLLTSVIAGRIGRRDTGGGRGAVVAVYEHVTYPPSDPPVPGEERAVMGRNLAAYQHVAAEAAGKGAKLIVFPEDGVYGTKFTRDSIKPYLEEIPDPKNVEANPCTDAKYHHLFVQNKLSCMARNNSIYVVANVGDRVPCSSEPHKACPADGQFQYNTNVAYDPAGRLVAKYHKRNLFYEYQFDQPDVEYAVFDTEFGRVGTMTCFDVLFKEPAIGLVEKYNIQHMAFPTAWGNAWPHLYSIQFHQAFGIRMGVNFLEAGFHRPVRMTGSGIYAGADRARAVYFNEMEGSDGGLVTFNVTDQVAKPARIEISPVAVSSNQNVFYGEVHRDIYTMVKLDGLEGDVNVTSKNVSCALSFKRRSIPDQEMYILAAFDGMHYSSLNWYIQSCVLLKCAGKTSDTCGKTILYADTVFEKFELRGQFGTEYVYPSVMSNDTNMPNTEWEYFIGQKDPGRAMIRSNGMTQPLVTASLYGRLYERDGNVKPFSSGGIINTPCWNLLPIFVLILHFSWHINKYINIKALELFQEKS